MGIGLSASSRTVRANGLSFNVVDHGQGEPVLLLHGFPDSSALWRNQVPALAAAGFRAIAPDLRGFGGSDRPEGREAYAMRALVGDALGILDELGVEKARVVGHDWGAALAWALAALAAARVDSLAALSVGHPNGYFASSRQRQRSWYMLFFAFEGVAETWLPRDDWRMLRTMAGDTGDVDRYIEDLSRPGALTAALNWYRANIAPGDFISREHPLPPVRCPTLGIWSTGDRFCGEEQMEGAGQFVQGPWRYERIEGSSHWIPLDAPDRLNDLLLDFLETRG